MSNDTTQARVDAMIGWDSFDPAVVERIRANDPQAIDRSAGGGIAVCRYIERKSAGLRPAFPTIGGGRVSA